MKSRDALMSAANLPRLLSAPPRLLSSNSSDVGVQKNGIHGQQTLGSEFFSPLAPLKKGSRQENSEPH